MSGAKIAMNTKMPTRKKPNDRAGVPDQPVPGLAPEPARPFEDDLGRLELGDAHEYRIRGLMIAYEMSTIRLTSTKMNAMNRIPPWITG